MRTRTIASDPILVLRWIMDAPACCPSCRHVADVDLAPYIPESLLSRPEEIDLTCPRCGHVFPLAEEAFPPMPEDWI